MKEQQDREEPEISTGPPTRRQMRLRQLQEQGSTAAVPIVPAPDRQTQSDPNGMTVEQALAARSDLAEQAKSHLARLEESAGANPEVVDPKILREQLALAERAAAINRAKVRQQRPEDQQSAAAVRTDPAEASNLGMVTPLEFVRVPGVDRPVLKPPATSYVPVVTRSRPKLAPSKASAAETSNGRSRVIARAEAVARAADRPPAQATSASRPAPAEPAAQPLEEQAPIAASSAYGLEPLDAATAGLARARRIKYLQYGVLAFGVLALAAGLILIISGMTR